MRLVMMLYGNNTKPRDTTMHCKIQASKMLNIFFYGGACCVAGHAVYDVVNSVLFGRVVCKTPPFERERGSLYYEIHIVARSLVICDAREGRGEWRD